MIFWNIFQDTNVLFKFIAEYEKYDINLFINLHVQKKKCLILLLKFGYLSD